MVLGGVPLKLGLGTPTFIGTPRIRGRYSGKKRKKNFFALKHFLEPIYEIKKNIYSILLEGGGSYRWCGKFQTFFFFLLNPSLILILLIWLKSGFAAFVSVCQALRTPTREGMWGWKNWDFTAVSIFSAANIIWYSVFIRWILLNSLFGNLIFSIQYIYENLNNFSL